MPAEPDGPAVSPPGRVDRRKLQTRRRLTRAAAQIIAEKGVEGLRLRELTAAADVGFGSFYNYFEDKGQLVEAVVVDLMSELAGELVRRNAAVGDPAAAAALAHRGFLRAAVARPQTGWLIVNLSRAEGRFEEAVRDHGLELLERGVASGRFIAFETEATLTYVVAATIGVARAMLEGRLGEDAEGASTRALLSALGLGPEEAERLASTPLEELARPG